MKNQAPATESRPSPSPPLTTPPPTPHALASAPHQAKTPPHPTPAPDPREAAYHAASELVHAGIYSVEERLIEQARRFDPGVEGYVSYVLSNGGKRLRPTLTLLAAGATGKISPAHLDLAIILELVHVASLVHDDIIDSAELRRSLPTAYAKWGSAISVLLGDALFAHALRLSTQFENSDVCRRIADAAVEVCSGEILQTQRRHDLKLTLPDYFKIIEMKTAALFGAAGELSALLNHSSPDLIRSLLLFGLKTGTAYQVYDDCLDVFGTETQAGKTLGTDLLKGKYTLPILLLLQRTKTTVSEKIRSLLLHAEDTALETELRRIAREENILPHCQTIAHDLLTDALNALQPLPPSPYAQGLKAIVDYISLLFERLEN